MELPGGAFWLPMAVLSVIGFILVICVYEQGYPDDGSNLNSTVGEINSDHYATNLIKITDSWLVRQRECDLAAHLIFFCFLMIVGLTTFSSAILYTSYKRKVQWGSEGSSLQTDFCYTFQIWWCVGANVYSVGFMNIYGSSLRLCILVIWFLQLLLAIMNKCVSSAPELKYDTDVPDYVVQMCEQLRLEYHPRQPKQPRLVTGDDVLKLV